MTTPATPARPHVLRKNPLQQLEIATPCNASWDAMVGNDRVRFCGQCSLNVYNLSAMGQQEALDLIATREGRLCVRLYKRADGTVISQDCPRGLEAVRRRVRRMAGAVVGALMTVAAGFGWMQVSRSRQVVMGVMAEPMPPEHAEMGKVARPVPQQHNVKR